MPITMSGTFKLSRILVFFSTLTSAVAQMQTLHYTEGMCKWESFIILKNSVNSILSLEANRICIFYNIYIIMVILIISGLKK